MTRWENEELWDRHGNYLGPGADIPLPQKARPHQCNWREPCGYFRCPDCRRVMPWCWGAADGPECDECWARIHVSAQEGWRRRAIGISRLTAFGFAALGLIVTVAILYIVATLVVVLAVLG